MAFSLLSWFQAELRVSRSSQFHGKLNVAQKAVVVAWLTGQAAQKHLPV